MNWMLLLASSDLKMTENHILSVLSYIKEFADFYSRDYHIDNVIMYNMYLVSRQVMNWRLLLTSKMTKIFFLRVLS